VAMLFGLTGSCLPVSWQICLGYGKI